MAPTYRAERDRGSKEFPQQLVLLLQHFKSQNLERIPVSPAEFVDYETRAHSFEKLGARVS